VIVNNGYLGMVRQWQDMFFEERFSQIHLTQALPDYALLARAYGALGFTAETEEELREALGTAFRSGRVCVIDARVDPREHCFPMIPSGAAAVDVLEYEPALQHVGRVTA
jgi:acetolactate synthase-1/2/3 large subunit